MKNHAFLICSLFIMSHLNLSAQLTISSTNKVGVGVSSPLSDLSIGAAGDANSTLFVQNSTASNYQRAARFYKSNNGGTWSYSIFNTMDLGSGNLLVGLSTTAYSVTALSSRQAFGLRAIAGNASSGYNYGVFGWLYGSNNGAAIYGCTDGLSTQMLGKYAGYFKGDVVISEDLTVDGVFYNSDMSLKENIRYLSEDELRQIDKLSSLSAIRYNLKSPLETDQLDLIKSDSLSTDDLEEYYASEKYEKDKLGLSAQEVAIVYPELVKTDGGGYLSLNYTGLVPVLVEAIKEQEEVITQQEDQISALWAEIDTLRELIIANESSKTE